FVAVRIVREQRVGIPVTSERGGIDELHRVEPPLASLFRVQTERAAAAEEIELRDRERIQRPSAVIGELDVDIRRECILRCDVDVHDSVVWLTGSDRDGLEKIERPQIPLALGEL